MPAGRSAIVVLILAIAVACSPREPATEVSKSAALDEAFSLLESSVDVPVVFPTLPRGTRLLSDESVLITRGRDATRAQITLETGTGAQVILLYGVAGFDGCGADPRPIRVAGQPGLVNVHDGWTDVIWPVVGAHGQGRYGVLAQLPRKKAVALARSMAAVAVEPGPSSSPGC